MWTLIRGRQEKEGKCFEERCRNLMVMTDEISTTISGCITITADGNNCTIRIHDPVVKKAFDMLAMQIGSLTLHGLSDDDNEAVENSRMVESEQRRWEQKLVWEDDLRREYLRRLWFRLYHKVHDCNCRQCLDFYLPHRDPTPSPPLPPMPEEDSDSDCS
ncbi:hypothetical protein N7471_007652 [Penicillium samsonianum]|uniref:uncharacterized protein n=1 Tax=Penicillium samsonianum TaxID=1882272 RepID=UPI002549B18D|nr:uncharacterized protein N7471_007652 [Penicillium samsonianum]KAJ6132437.1 hypothetical protein N7471_007652 [Penicillium samsonianum]